MRNPETPARLFAAALLAGFLAAHAARAAMPPIEAFARMPNIQNVAISPNGRSLSWLAPVKDKHVLVVLDLASGTGARRVLSADGTEFDITHCAWANDTRLLCALLATNVEAGYAYPITRLLGLNADASQQKVLMKDIRVSGSQLQDRILDWTPDDPDTVLIMANATAAGLTEFSQSVGDTVDYFPSVFELNVDDGRLRLHDPAHPPIRQFITDARGHVRFGIGVEGTQISYYARREGETEWRRLDKFEAFERDRPTLEPVAIGQQPNTMYAVGSFEGRDALWTVDLTDKEAPQVLFSHPLVDIGDALFATDGRLIGVQYDTDREFVYYTDPHAREVMQAVNDALPGKFNAIEDSSRDEQTYVIRSRSDVDDGSYFLYERAPKKLRRIAVAYPELDPAQLATIRSIAYPARDGTSIPGYLTVPPGVKAEHLPLIVMPHGGPIARDSWAFDFLQQFLVSRGYAVLQMNFRGSSGYGADWYFAAHQDWGGLTYDDITDGARWAVKQGIADPKRLCIVGWSFGGYAALLGAVRNSDLYRCSVSIAGVSDLMALERFRSKIAERQIGTNWAKLRENSPRRHADSVAIPVLMFHGDLDYQADVEQSRLMARALQDAHKSYQLVLLKGASHQLDRESDRLKLLTEVEKFLAVNLGPGVTTP